MRKNKLLIVILSLVLCVGLFGCKNKEKVINVCASDVPHAEILESIVKDILKEKGYKLNVTILDWTIQNEGVAKKDYDANYFQHVPYLESDDSAETLFAACKVHYEPLGIYEGKKKDINEGKSFEICDDISNGIRAFELLFSNNILNLELETENNNLPYNTDKSAFTFNTTSWTSSNGIVVTLVSEETLVERLYDYDFGVLPCNTALTGNISADKRVVVESDENQVSGKANIIAARENDYKENKEYKEKIDALVDAILSNEVREFIIEKYNGVIICDDRTQVDLR